MKKILLSIIGIVVLGVAWYGLSPLFMNKRVDDTLPETIKIPTQEKTIDKEDTSTTEDIPSKTMISEPVSVVDTPAHPASGQVRIVRNGDETIVRYENYKTINGPDVRVYLANDLDAKGGYVDLGLIKGTEGNINYPIPTGVNIDDYRYVLTWCEDFSVLFNSADLSPLSR